MLQYQVLEIQLAVSNTVTNTPIILPAQMYELNDPWDKFEQKICILEPNGVDTDCWGMKNHMTLFDMDNKAEVECEKTVDTDNDGTKRCLRISFRFNSSKLRKF